MKPTAAKVISKRPRRVYNFILSFGRRHGQFTAWQIASVFHLSIDNARSDCNQLRRLGEIEVESPGKRGRFGSKPG